MTQSSGVIYNKKDKSLQFKTIDGEDQIEKLVVDGISNNLNQAEGAPLTIELLYH